MLKVKCYTTGSTANFSVIKDVESFYIVDLGVSAKKALVYLTNDGLQIDKCLGVIVTHNHSDHIRGLKTFCKLWDLPVITTDEVYKTLDFKYKRVFIDIDFVKVLHTGQKGNLVSTVGFKIGTVGWLTDSGVLKSEFYSFFKGVETMVIECNYDEDILEDNIKACYNYGRKHYLNRVANGGHMSNFEAELLLEALDPVKAIAVHLSKANNHPSLVKSVFEGIVISERDKAISWV